MSRIGGLSSRDQRAIRWGLGVLGLSLLYVFGVRPYAETLGGTNQRLAIERSLLARERALVDASESVTASLQEARAAVVARLPWLLAEDATLAGGSLLRYVVEQAERSRVMLEVVDTREAGSVGAGIGAVQLELRSVGDIEGLLRFIHGLETGPKLISIERLALEQRSHHAAVDEQDDVRILAAVLTISGYTAAISKFTPAGTE